MSLQDLVQGWAARGFADFPGLAIDGSIPLKQELVNQLIAEFLNSPPAASPGRPGIPEPLRPVLLQMIKKLEVRATEGVITVHLELRS
jgi:hypothetical protein